MQFQADGQKRRSLFTILFVISELRRYEYKMKYFASLLLFVFFIPVNTLGEEIKNVVVRDNKFEIVNILVAEKELEKFTAIWKTRHEIILRAMPEWTHKIDIFPDSRWLYHPNGYTMVLSKQAAGIFKIDANIKFNELLKIHNKSINKDNLLNGKLAH